MGFIATFNGLPVKAEDLMSAARVNMDAVSARGSRVIDGLGKGASSALLELYSKFTAAVDQLEAALSSNDTVEMTERYISYNNAFSALNNELDSLENRTTVLARELLYL